MKEAFTVCVFSILAVTLAWAEEPVDLDMVNKIRDEGFNRSEVMESLRVLADEIGPRLTASPGMRAASKWTVDALQSWGVDNVYLEGFEFGRGWSVIRSEIHMTSPRRAQLHGLPVEWHPGTDGVLEGEIVHALISSAEDFPKWQGKPKGKMVLIDEVSPPRERANKIYGPLDEAELDGRALFKVPVGDRPSGDEWPKDLKFLQERSAFLAREGALLIVRNNGRDDMAISNTSYQYHAGMTPDIPGRSDFQGALRAAVATCRQRQSCADIEGSRRAPKANRSHWTMERRGAGVLRVWATCAPKLW
ncbi:MAG: hypothetical protein IIB77_05745 [Proteobacteria bacterium]|nr:hypothetical protein [Pseudomonadota bacterium]